MTDRVTRGTPAFNPLLWDTSSIPPLEQPKPPPAVERPASEPRPDHIAIVLLGTALGLVAIGNLVLYFLQR